jgi:hypothetical protein
MQLDRVAQKVILDSLRRAIPSQWPAKVEALRSLAAQGGDPSLASYLDESGLELEDVCDGKRGWSDLRSDAGLPVFPSGPEEAPFRRALGRLLHVDDQERIAAYRRFLAAAEPPKLDRLSERERRHARMLVAQLGYRVIDKSTSLHDGMKLLWQHPQVRAEGVDVLDLLAKRVDHLQARLASRPDVPLQVHARYTRLEILGAFDVGEGARIAAWQTGVRWLPEDRADLFAFTLDKTAGSFSPTTRYRDYAISQELIHWESQGVTRENSRTGRRYRHHASMGSEVLLFARVSTEDRAFWFLGPVTYVSHKGERPMAITWRLEHRLPGDLFARFAAAVA